MRIRHEREKRKISRMRIIQEIIDQFPLSSKTHLVDSNHGKKEKEHRIQIISPLNKKHKGK